MKTATFYAVLTIVASFGLTAFGKPACNGDGGEQSVGGTLDSFPAGDSFPPVDQIPELLPAPVPINPNTAPTGPQARITPLDSAPQNPTAPSARVSLVPDAPLVAANANEPSATKPDVLPGIDAALTGLVGTWSTPSRFGDGELTTVEVRFDDRGWAELTVPAADGKRSTIKRRVSLEDKELKLSGPDEETLSLGKLIEFDNRQLVLERSGRQITFVRRTT